MLTRIDWDWEPGSREIANISGWQKKFNWVEEPFASPNGEKIAAVVNLAEGEFNVCVNDDTWQTVFDKIWNLRFAPDGRLTAIVSEMGEWTVAVDGTPWDNKFGYVWNMMFSPDGNNIAVAVQQDMAYGMALNNVVWEETFSNMTHPTLSPDGTRTAAAVTGGRGPAESLRLYDCRQWNTLGTNL
jgi:Tol biopolymer transport system component